MRESQKKQKKNQKKLKRILAHLQEFFESILENRNDACPNMLYAGELPQSVTVYKRNDNFYRSNRNILFVLSTSF